MSGISASPQKNLISQIANENIYSLNFADDKKIEEFFQKEDSDEDEDEKEIKNEKEKSLMEMKNDKTENNLNDKVEINNLNNNNDQYITLKSEEDLTNSGRSLFNRILGPVDAGSIRGSIFSLSILSLGSGCLNLPQKMGQMSIFVTILDIFCSGFATYLTLNLLIISSKKAKKFNYYEVVNELFGKIAAIILIISCLIYNYGIIILYMVISNL
jgi:hypothetical protein